LHIIKQPQELLQVVEDVLVDIAKMWKMQTKEDIVDAQQEELALLPKQSLEELLLQVADVNQLQPEDVTIKEKIAWQEE